MELPFKLDFESRTSHGFYGISAKREEELAAAIYDMIEDYIIGTACYPRPQEVIAHMFEHHVASNNEAIASIAMAQTIIFYETLKLKL